MERQEQRLEAEEEARRLEAETWWKERVPLAIRELLATTAENPKVMTGPFLTALMGRLEHHELDVTERIAQQQQSTAGRLQAIEAALTARVQVLETELRETQSAARHAEDALLLRDATAAADAAEQAADAAADATKRLRVTGDGGNGDEVHCRHRDADEDAESALRAQLVDLIHVGLSRLQEKIFTDGQSTTRAKEENETGKAKDSEAQDRAAVGKNTTGGSVLAKYSTGRGAAGPTTMEEVQAEKNDQQQFLAAVHHRLEAMGW